MTPEQYAQFLENCDFSSPQAVSDLVTSTHTNVKFNEVIQEWQGANPLGAYNYFSGLFGTRVWEDGQGMDEIREYATPAHIPFTFSHFVRESAICDPNLANECIRDRCSVPAGGRGTLPGFKFFKWGFKTERDCIANVRSIRQYRYWSARVTQAMESIDEQVMNMFYVMAGIQTAGGKITMQGVRDAQGRLILMPSSDPRNPLRGGLYNYLQDKFPQPTDLNDIVPLTIDTLRPLADHWAQFPTRSVQAKGPSGESIYEFWYPDNFYEQEAARNPDYIEKIKLTMPNTLFPGTSRAEGMRQVVGNWAPRSMPWLPRFAPTDDGQIVPVDNKIGVDIEVGQEFLGSRDFEYAPFGIATIVNGKQGSILTRPTLTTSGAGFPIHPIAGNAPWWIRNDYDKECNPDLNMPFAQKDHELGFVMDDPSAAISFLFRRRVYLGRAINECDLAPIFNVEPNTVDCPITTLGCGTNKRRESDNIIEPGGPLYVSCSAQACGDKNTAPYHYSVKIDRRANMVGFNSLGCPCGSNVTLYVYDSDSTGAPRFLRTIQGFYLDSGRAFPDARFFIQTTVKLAAGECIKGIACTDLTPLQGNVIEAFDLEPGRVGVLLDGSIVCGKTDDVLVRYYDSTGKVLGTINAVIAEFDPTRYYYELTSSNPSFAADGVYLTQASMGVSCNEAPNTSSSSSGLP